MQARGWNEVKHEQVLGSLEGLVPSEVWARYNAGLHRTN